MTSRPSCFGMGSYVFAVGNSFVCFEDVRAQEACVPYESAAWMPVPRRMPRETRGDLRHQKPPWQGHLIRCHIPQEGLRTLQDRNEPPGIHRRRIEQLGVNVQVIDVGGS